MRILTHLVWDTQNRTNIPVSIGISAKFHAASSDPESIALHVSQVTTVNRPNGPMRDAALYLKAGVTSTHLGIYLKHFQICIQLGTV
jgi:hypothetical protein